MLPTTEGQATGLLRTAGQFTLQGSPAHAAPIIASLSHSAAAGARSAAAAATTAAVAATTSRGGASGAGSASA